MKKSFCLFLMILLAISMFVGCNPSPKVLKSIAVTKEPTAVQYQGFPLNTTGIEITGTYSDNTTQVLPVENFDFDPNTVPTTDTDVTVTVKYKQDTTIKTTFVIKPIKDAVSSISVAQKPTKTEYQSGEHLDLAGLKISVNYTKRTPSDIIEYGTEEFKKTFITSPTNGATLSTSDKKVTVTLDADKTKTTDFTITVNPVASKDTTLGAKDSWFTTLVAGDIAKKNEIDGIEFTTELPSDVSYLVKDVDLTEKKTGLVKGYITEDYKVYVVGQKITANADSSSMFAGFTNMKTFKADNLNTINVTDMSNMFDGCSKVTELEFDWETNSVKKMGSMFSGCKALAGITFGEKFDTSNVSVMSAMFSGCEKLEKLDLDDFDTSRVTTMSAMFKDCSSLKDLDVSSFDTSRVLVMSSMFSGCEKLEKLDFGDDFDTSRVTVMNAMFKGCSSLKKLDVSSFDTDYVLDMSSMFQDCKALESLDLSNWETGDVLMNVSHMFYGCEGLLTIYVDEDFEIPSDAVDLFNAMFKGCKSIIGGNGTKYDSSNTSKTYAVIDKEGTKGYLTDVREKYKLKAGADIFKGLLDTAKINKKDVSFIKFTDSLHKKSFKVETTSTDLTNRRNGAVIGSIGKDDNGKWGILVVGDSICLNENCSGMFKEFTSVTELTFGDSAVVDTSLVTDMSYMFASCTDLIGNTTIVQKGKNGLWLESFKTSNVTNMTGMFKGCSNLTTIFVSGSKEKWNTEKVTESTDMFKDCLKLEGEKGTKYVTTQTGITYAKIDGGTDSPGYLTDPS